jgi:hypothetical protein
MAIRPVFYPKPNSAQLFGRTDITIPWHGGFSISQKQKNIRELHKAARLQGFGNILEISSKSEDEIGRRLSAFSLKYDLKGKNVPFECIYQGSKVFENGGPYQELYDRSPIECKKDARIKNSGRIVSFRLQEKEYPTIPTNIFYDWIYISILSPHEEYLQEKLLGYDGFTDIEFNPEKSINCQARALSIMIALTRSSQLKTTMQSFENFKNTIGRIFSVL